MADITRDALAPNAVGIADRELTSGLGVEPQQMIDLGGQASS